MANKPREIKNNRVKTLLGKNSQAWLIKHTPLSKDAVFEIYNDKRNLSVGDMSILSKIFKVPVSELFTNKGLFYKSENN